LHRQFPGWSFVKVVGGQNFRWSEGEPLRLPVHEIHASSNDAPPRAIEFLLNERDADHWLFRRNPSVRLPLGQAIVRAGNGLPVLAPEIVLLYKSKSPREKDESDLRSAWAACDARRRQW